MEPCWRLCDGGGSYSLGTLHILAYSVSFMTPQRWHHHPVFTGAEADAVPFRHLGKTMPPVRSKPRSSAISSAKTVTSMLLMTAAALHVSTALWNCRWEPGALRIEKHGLRTTWTSFLTHDCLGSPCTPTAATPGKQVVHGPDSRAVRPLKGPWIWCRTFVWRFAHSQKVIKGRWSLSLLLLK